MSAPTAPWKEDSGPSFAPDTRVLVAATSLNPGSHSCILARKAHARLRAMGVEAEFIALRDLDLPFATGTKEHDRHPGVLRIKEACKRATHVLLAVPVYNGDVNGAARNLLNLGCDFGRKTVGFMAAAGGQSSYMAVYSIGISLMFEFEAWIVPRHLYAVGSDFQDGTVANPEILKRMERLIADLLSRAPVAREVNAAAQ